VPFDVFISMENKSTTKATIKKAHFIASMIPSKSYPIDVVEYILELTIDELSQWNSNTIYEFQYYLFKIPQKKFFQKISCFIESIEVESDGENQLLTIRFMFVGNLSVKEVEDIGIQFRKSISNRFNGNLHIKLNRKLEHLDLTLLITPLQLIDPKKTLLFPDWLMEKIIVNPLTVVPNSFFIEGLHKELNTSII
jgi:hypothetical protein